MIDIKKGQYCLPGSTPTRRVSRINERAPLSSASFHNAPSASVAETLSALHSEKTDSVMRRQRLERTNNLGHPERGATAIEPRAAKTAVCEKQTTTVGSRESGRSHATLNSSMGIILSGGDMSYV